MSTFEFKLTVEVERESGVFGSREVLAEQIREAIEEADPGDLYVEGASGGEGNYVVIDWAVEEDASPKLPTAAQRDAAIRLLRGDLSGPRAQARAMADWIERNVGVRPSRRTRS